MLILDLLPLSGEETFCEGARADGTLMMHKIAEVKVPGRGKVGAIGDIIAMLCQEIGNGFGDVKVSGFAEPVI